MFTRPRLYLRKVSMKKTRTSTARSKAFVEAAKLQSGEMSTIKDSNDEDLIPSRSTIARVVARHVNDSSDSNQQHCHSSAFKRDRGPPDRSSAMEPCLNDRSRPERRCGFAVAAAISRDTGMRSDAPFAVLPMSVQGQKVSPGANLVCTTSDSRHRFQP